MNRFILLLCGAVALSGCSGYVDPPPPDAGAGDAGSDDAGSDDAGQGHDAGSDDAGQGHDAGSNDAGPQDAGRGHDGGPGPVCDADDDGDDSIACGGTDCDDTDPTRHGGATEVCNTVDDDCDGAIDEGVCVPCPAGYTGFDGACTDIDECAAGGAATCHAARPCVNDPGGYSCGPCASGWLDSGLDGCTDINECSEGTDLCSGLRPCANVAGGYVCAECPSGYANDGDHECADVDECAVDNGGCDALATCVNEPGSHSCQCPTDYVLAPDGLDCLYDVAALASLVPSSGTLSPAFAPGTTMYTLGLPRSVASLTLTPVASAAATITVQGVPVASGSASAALPLTVGTPNVVAISVTAESGRVTTYTLIVTRLDQEAYLKASNTDASDSFGSSVALSSDGSTLAVGAYGESSSATGTTATAAQQADNAALRSGAVYVFRRTGASWTQEAYLKASNTGVGDRFGGCVALSSDGATLAVGALQEDSNATGTTATAAQQADNSASASGAVYVFRRAGTSWSQEAYLKASNTGVNDSFGSSVALSLDGSTLAVGADREDSNAIGTTASAAQQAGDSALDSGAVYVFRRTGTSWSQEAYLKASNTGEDDRFGGSVALSSDGATLAVGALQEDSNATGTTASAAQQADDSSLASGAVYVFRRAGTSWTQEAYLKASNTDAYDYFGSSVALSSDGSTLAVGANNEDSNATGTTATAAQQANNSARGSGAVYVFRRAGTSWTQEAYLKASNTGAGDRFGGSVALSLDGATLAVGAWLEDSNATGTTASAAQQANDSALDSGAVYVLRRAGTSWSQEAYLKASNTGAADHFGSSVALSPDGSTLAVGATFEDSNATGTTASAAEQADDSTSGSGAVYVFR